MTDHDKHFKMPDQRGGWQGRNTVLEDLLEFMSECKCRCFGGGSKDAVTPYDEVGDTRAKICDGQRGGEHPINVELVVKRGILDALSALKRPDFVKAWHVPLPDCFCLPSV